MFSCKQGQTSRSNITKKMFRWNDFCKDYKDYYKNKELFCNTFGQDGTKNVTQSTLEEISRSGTFACKTQRFASRAPSLAEHLFKRHLTSTPVFLTRYSLRREGWESSSYWDMLFCWNLGIHNRKFARSPSRELRYLVCMWQKLTQNEFPPGRCTQQQRNVGIGKNGRSAVLQISLWSRSPNMFLTLSLSYKYML